MILIFFIQHFDTFFFNLKPHTHNACMLVSEYKNCAKFSLRLSTYDSTSVRFGLVWLLHNDCKNFILKKKLFLCFSIKKNMTRSTRLDATDTISSTHATSQQVVCWTPIIATSPNQIQTSRGWLVCGAPSSYVESPEGECPMDWSLNEAPSTYVGNWEEGML